MPKGKEAGAVETEADRVDHKAKRPKSTRGGLALLCGDTRRCARAKQEKDAERLQAANKLSARACGRASLAAANGMHTATRFANTNKHTFKT